MHFSLYFILVSLTLFSSALARANPKCVRTLATYFSGGNPQIHDGVWPTRIRDIPTNYDKWFKYYEMGLQGNPAGHGTKIPFENNRKRLDGKIGHTFYQLMGWCRGQREQDILAYGDGEDETPLSVKPHISRKWLGCKSVVIVNGLKRSGWKFEKRGDYTVFYPKKYIVLRDDADNNAPSAIKKLLGLPDTTEDSEVYAEYKGFGDPGYVLEKNNFYFEKSNIPHFAYDVFGVTPNPNLGKPARRYDQFLESRYDPRSCLSVGPKLCYQHRSKFACQRVKQCLWFKKKCHSYTEINPSTTPDRFEVLAQRKTHTGWITPKDGMLGPMGNDWNMFQPTVYGSKLNVFQTEKKSKRRTLENSCAVRKVSRKEGINICRRIAFAYGAPCSVQQLLSGKGKDLVCPSMNRRLVWTKSPCRTKISRKKGYYVMRRDAKRFNGGYVARCEASKRRKAYVTCCEADP